MKFPTIEEMAQNIAEKALDEVEYNGKTLREWMEIISAIPVTAIPATDNNVDTKLGTNLAEVGTDCISREQAIEALGELATFTEDWSCHTWMYTDDVYNAIKQLPPIQPVIAPCDYAKACNEATMDKLTSAVAYYDALEELRKHGYVLVDMREVNHESN